MVPPKPEVQDRYLAAATTVEVALTGDCRISEALLAAISEVKGLFNRSRRQDQPDWFLVWERLGLPSLRRLGLIVRDLNNWRSAVKIGAATEAEAARERLQRGGVVTALRYFLGQQALPEEAGAGYLYLLSNRNDRTLLKIGRSTREVAMRVNEINNATGIVDPFGVRHLWRVRDATTAESNVHALLAEFRVRTDREFFRLEHREAVARIDRYLQEAGAKLRKRGTVKWLFRDRGYGFIEASESDYFFHAYDVEGGRFETLAEGDTVEFDRADTTHGVAAIGVWAIP
jgi:cold shock CspA family protein